MQSTKFSINPTIDKIVEFAPLFLFTMLFIVLFLTGYLQRQFYTQVFTGVMEQTEYLAFLFPVVIQVLRLVTGFLSASFFKKHRYAAGIAVLIFSIWLTMFEHNEAKHMGEFWVNSSIDLSTVVQSEMSLNLTKDIITSMMHILIWGALFLEIFLAVWLSFDSSKNENEGYVFSQNGATKKERSPSLS